MTRRTISSIDSSTMSFLPFVRVTTVSGVSSTVSIISALRTNSPFLCASDLNFVSLIIRPSFRRRKPDTKPVHAFFKYKCVDSGRENSLPSLSLREPEAATLRGFSAQNIINASC